MVYRNYSYLQRYSRNTWVCVVVDYTETQSSNSVMEYHRKSKKVRETILSCSYESVESLFSKLNEFENLVTLSLFTNAVEESWHSNLP